MKRSVSNVFGRALVVALVCAAPAAVRDAQAGTPAATAADVCSAGADPCNVTTVFDVANGASLDFGARAVSLSSAGQFNFGTGNGSILCGSFSASTINPAINSGGPLGDISTSGTVAIEARRACSSLDAQSKKVPCLDGTDCQIGPCGVRRCSTKPSVVCTGDDSCQLGACVGTTANNKRCANLTSVRCTTNADCDYGTCPVQLTCANRALTPVNCSTNSDCAFGTCSTGTGSITLGGSISGNSDNPAFVTLSAADSVSISKLVNLNSTNLANDGGDLVINAVAGSVAITAPINAVGGGDGAGGTAEISAGTDITIADVLDFSGGEGDGGAVDIGATRDLIIGRSILANSNSGGGYGGEIMFEAGRDIVVNGVSSLNRTRIENTASTNAIDSFAGDGGTQNFTTGRHLIFNEHTRVDGNGASPDGSGGDLFLDVGGNLTVAGTIRANAGQSKGAGGFIEIFVTGDSSVTSAGAFEAIGGSGGGGGLEFASTGNVDWAGGADVSGLNTGVGGSSFVDCGGTAKVSGTFAVSGEVSGSLEVESCRLELSSTGKLTNTAVSGDNRLMSRESMKLLAGSAMTTTSGTNTLEYRTSAKPPLRQGTITPTPTLLLNSALVGCPVCGNGEVDEGETCDDGTTSGAGNCTSDCQNKKCVNQTQAPGYPTVPLCDDGNACTTDSCDTTLNGGTCLHPAKTCNDMIACTVDTCDDGNCVYTPNDLLCNDGNVCTDDFCAVDQGCSGTANTAPCSDNNTCTNNDICSGKVCTGSQIPDCGVCGDNQVNPPEQCDDGNATFVSGEYCGVNCVLIPCGKPTNSSGTNPKSSDALFTLKAAVGQAKCSLRVCDVDNSTKIVSSDALRVLRKAVGQNVTLNCPTS